MVVALLVCALIVIAFPGLWKAIKFLCVVALLWIVYAVETHAEHITAPSSIDSSSWASTLKPNTGSDVVGGNVDV